MAGMLTTDDPMIVEEYTDLLMLQQRLQGKSYEDIGRAHNIAPDVAEARINDIGSECMRGAMAATRGDPDHPQAGLFTLEDFTADPRRAMEVVMQKRIETIEARYGCR